MSSHHTLNEVRAEYRRLDKLIGIDTTDIELNISSRAVKRLGCFTAPKRAGSSPLRITLSEYIMGQDELFWQTVRHEYAHAAVYILYPNEHHVHDKRWQDMCRRIGCSSDRLAAAPELACAAQSREAKYIVRCKGCGAESRYLRKGKVVDIILSGGGKNVRCTACGGHDFEVYVRK